jgi:2-methylcitrate dehydratase PrpD
MTGARPDTGDAFRWRELPDAVRERITLLMLDFAAVAVAGRDVPAATLAVEHAEALHPGAAATALLDGRRVSAAGAAWANGVLANALDLDDGHRLAKGHPGACVIPAALAAAEATDAMVEDLLEAIGMGYELAIAAGVELHARTDDYHASGAWGALGAAGAAGRLFGLDARRLRHALGIAEYHAPMAPILRSVADPAMTKDAVGWGAFVGVSSAMLARRGFTSVRSEFVAGGGLARMARGRHLLDVYVKPYPCCRWTQGAIRAALELRTGHGLAAEDVRAVTIRTFRAAAELARRLPTTTEEAQYSLAWPVAVALARGGFDVSDVVGDFDDPLVAATFERIDVVIDPELSAAFPQRRLTDVAIELADGSIVSSGPVEAPGEPDDPDWRAIVLGKAHRFLPAGVVGRAIADPAELRLGCRSLDDLLAVLAMGARPA